MTSSQSFFDECIEKSREHLDRALNAVKELSNERLNKRPVSGEWSCAQIFKHLSLSDEPYVQSIKAHLTALPMDATNKPPKHTMIGGMIARATGPGTNAPAPQKLIPQDQPLPQTVVEEWASLQQQLIDLMESARGRDLNIKFIKNPIVSLFKFNLTDCFGILVNHTERHVQQIEERAAGSC